MTRQTSVMNDFADKDLLPAGMCDVLPPDAEIEAEDSTPADVEPKPTGTEIPPDQDRADSEEKPANLYAQLDTQIRKDNMNIPKPPGAPSITVLPVPVTEKVSSSTSDASQKDPPIISPLDPNNDNLLITKSIYNIIQ